MELKPGLSALVTGGASGIGNFLDFNLYYGTTDPSFFNISFFFFLYIIFNFLFLKRSEHQPQLDQITVIFNSVFFLFDFSDLCSAFRNPFESFSYAVDSIGQRCATDLEVLRFFQRR